MAKKKKGGVKRRPLRVTTPPEDDQAAEPMTVEAVLKILWKLPPRKKVWVNGGFIGSHLDTVANLRKYLQHQCGEATAVIGDNHEGACQYVDKITEENGKVILHTWGASFNVPPLKMPK